MLAYRINPREKLMHCTFDTSTSLMTWVSSSPAPDHIHKAGLSSAGPKFLHLHRPHFCIADPLF